ncbi:hypothetical protein ACOL3H_07055 [Aliarcobacter butzleri]
MKKSLVILFILSNSLFSEYLNLDIENNPYLLEENIDKIVCVHNVCGTLKKKEFFNDIPHDFDMFSIEDCKTNKCKKIEILFKKEKNLNSFIYPNEKAKALIERITSYSK